ncbi:MAG: aspartate kinase [Marinilabiliaceae bacterium]|nr:aspartate kinase [Marinilabiliaceae bacterium]
MRVLKFGGTSVGSADRIKEVAQLIQDEYPKIVVLSAMSGTTNTLVEICNYLYKKNVDGANETISGLESKYYQVVKELLTTGEYVSKGNDLVKEHFDYIRTFVTGDFSVVEEKTIHAEGELLSTNLMQFHLEETGVKSALLPALDYMKTDVNNEPDYAFIKENLTKILDKYSGVELFITQGYICRNVAGEIDNLQRGGSDYTASIVGAAADADEIQIWTDIDGMHNNDPRFVEGTKSISDLSFDEAAELAYFGAKILHPTSVLPAKLSNIPVRLLNTMKPDAKGTLISGNQIKNRIAAVAAKDGITAIKIKSGRMLLAYGFLRKIFEIFESYKTPIDMVTTSEVGVSLTIDNNKNIDSIVADLKKYGTVEVSENMVIVCVVGDLTATTKGEAARIFNGLKGYPIHMISYGGSNYNVSLLIDAENKKAVLNELSNTLF